MVLLVERIAAGNGLDPIMLLSHAVWESPCRVNHNDLDARDDVIILRSHRRSRSSQAC
jgi:hypothetical protein